MSTKQEIERARLALARFRGAEATLSSFASALSERDLTVVAGAETGTNGEVIHVTPPLGMAEEVDHDLSRCHRRGADGEFLCRACGAWDEVLVNVFHEIAHVIHGHIGTKRAVRDIRAGLPKYAKIMRAAGYRVDYDDVSDHLGVHNAIPALKGVDPWLPLVVNVLEDVRIDLLMIEAKRGLARSHANDLRALAGVGRDVVLPDGTTRRIQWGDAPRDAQFLLALYIAGVGHDLFDWCEDEEIVALAQSDAFEEIVRSARGARSLEGVMPASALLLVWARSEGYLLDPENQPLPSGSAPSEEGEAEEGEEGEQEESEQEGDGDEETESVPEDQDQGDAPEGGDSDSGSGGSEGEGDDSQGGGGSTGGEERDESGGSDVPAGGVG